MIWDTKLLVLMAVLWAVATAAPYQELPPRPGYVPVYIREGNTPLSQVNPKLVEAFHEDVAIKPTQNKPEAPQEAEVSYSDKVNKSGEDTKRDAAVTHEQTEHLPGSDEKPTAQEKSHEDDAKAVHIAAASDISKFSSDDIITLADDSTKRTIEERQQQK